MVRLAVLFHRDAADLKQQLQPIRMRPLECDAAEPLIRSRAVKDDVVANLDITRSPPLIRGDWIVTLPHARGCSRKSHHGGYLAPELRQWKPGHAAKNKINGRSVSDAARFMDHDANP